MNRPSVKIRHGQCNWPRHCAVCLNHPGGVVKVSRKLREAGPVWLRLIPLVGLIPRTAHVTTLEYPVCPRHRTFSRMVSALGSQNLFNLFLLVVSIAWLMAGLVVAALNAAEGDTIAAGTFLVHAAIAAIVPVVYFWARRRMPVKITLVDEQSLTLSFGNSVYCEYFKGANRGLLI